MNQQAIDKLSTLSAIYPQLLVEQIQYAKSRIYPIALDELDAAVFLCSAANLGIDGWLAVDTVLMNLADPFKRDKLCLHWELNIYKDLSWLAGTFDTSIEKTLGVTASRLIQNLLHDFGGYMELRKAAYNL